VKRPEGFLRKGDEVEAKIIKGDNKKQKNGTVNKNLNLIRRKNL
jgi:ribosomal protein S1